MKIGITLWVAAHIAGVMMASIPLWAGEHHAVRGVVLKVDVAHHQLLVSCEAIPGYMDAMEMPFTVRNAKALAALKPGEGISFTMDAQGSKMYAREIHAGATATYETEPMQAGQLTAMSEMLEGTKALKVGEHVSDFALTDQSGATVHLAQSEGKVVALTFGYSRCPNPNYCFRLSNNLAKVEKRFHDRMGRDLVLMTIMIDPEHDQGAALAQYAGVWKADAASWHFLTGPRPEIQQIAGMFGMNFWRVEGLLTHSLHTVIIDRQGKLAANLEGNQFSVKELGDLLNSVMDRR
jgi:protein SCO1/2